jgi:phage tail sheath protein FI
MLDPSVSTVNILAIPGIKEPFVTDYVSDATELYSKAIYLMDIPSYDDQGNRLFTYGSRRPDTNTTIDSFSSRAYDNSYVATYYPDVSVVDQNTGRPVQVAASVAALSALGFNDSVSFPWFAPAGFNRGALENFTNVAVRLNSADRDRLYTNRINPIASFPNAGFVIFGQKTLQLARSSLDRVNVRRMLLEVKRIASTAALNFIFEQNNSATRSAFVARLTPSLSLIQSQQGVDQFKIVCDGTNNTQEDINNNRLNCKIIVAPTRAVEFIVVNFVVDSTGVTFA